MRFLIVGVSLLFSFIFYLFYTANLGKNIFFQSSENVFYGKTLLGSFIYFPILFLLLAVFFFFIFKGNVKNISNNQSEEEDFGPVQEKEPNYISLYIIFGIIIGVIFYFFGFNFLYLFGLFTVFISFHFLSRVLYFYHKIENNSYVKINIFSIIFGYLFSIGSVIFIYFYSEFQLFSQSEAILFYIWITIVSFFHIYIHIRYINIISLLIGVITFIFSLYSIIHTLFPGII